MFGRIGLGERPLLDRIMNDRSPAFDAGGFGSTVPPLYPAPPTPQPRSPVDELLTPAQNPATVPDAMAAISNELTQHLDTEEARSLFLAWSDFRERITASIDARKSARRTDLENKIAELTRTGRATIDRLQALVNERGGWLGTLNIFEGQLSKARAALLGATAGNPAAGDESYALPEEIEAWKVTVAQAQQGVDEKERETQPIRDKIAALTAQIDAESRTLKQITEERRNRRLEMQDGVKRVAGSGLQGRVGATTF